MPKVFDRYGVIKGGGGGGVTDHGALSGLSDDDHTQYILVNASRAFTSAPSSNVAATLDVHLIRKGEMDAAFGSITSTFLFLLGTYSPVGHTHVVGDITSGVFPPARLGTGSTGGTSKFLREDGTFAVPPGTGGGGGSGNTYFPSGW